MITHGARLGLDDGILDIMLEGQVEWRQAGEGYVDTNATEGPFCLRSLGPQNTPIDVSMYNEITDATLDATKAGPKDPSGPITE